MLPQNSFQQFNVQAISDWLDSEQGPLYKDLAFSKGWSNEIICEIDKKRHSHSFSISITFQVINPMKKSKVVLEHVQIYSKCPFKV